jgi:hypothetical protein
VAAMMHHHAIRWQAGRVRAESGRASITCRVQHGTCHVRHTRIGISASSSLHGGAVATCAARAIWPCKLDHAICVCALL